MVSLNTKLFCFCFCTINLLPPFRKKSPISLWKFITLEKLQNFRKIKLIKIKQFIGVNTKFDLKLDVVYFQRNQSFKKCQQTLIWAKIAKSGQKLLSLFTFLIILYFFRSLLNLGKLSKLIFPLKYEVHCCFLELSYS